EGGWASGRRQAPGPARARRNVGNLRQLRIVTVAVHDCLLKIGMEWRFYACEKTRAQKDSVGAKRQRSHKAPSIGKSAGREDRNGRDRIDDHRNERHARHPAHMTAPFSALCNDNISTGLCCAYRFRYGTGHVGDLAAGPMGPIEVTRQVLLGPRPRELYHAWSEFERCGDTVLTHVEHQEVQAERVVSFAADSRCV